MLAVDFANNKLEAVNMGIGIVTPITEVLAILNSPALIQERRRQEAQTIS